MSAIDRRRPVRAPLVLISTILILYTEKNIDPKVYISISNCDSVLNFIVDNLEI
jgi:hypothetical protein